MQMTPKDLQLYLDGLVSSEIQQSLMIWGPPGIGKSSIVADIVTRHDFQFVDLRLSQLAPTDLRGLPVAENGLSKWFPPEFLPTGGKGVLFLDEINMAPPAMQGVAQQLILDRKVGSYQVPAGWFIWAAGNRKEDKAAVYQMPSALANRFMHLEITPDFESFKFWGLQNEVSEEILAFLAFRPSLLHKIHNKHPAWPSPRSWEMADKLFKANLSVEPAVGHATDEFNAFLAVYTSLPDLDAILAGKSKTSFPDEPSKRYATTLGLVVRAKTADNAFHAVQWIAENADAEWLQFFITSLFPVLRENGQMASTMKLMAGDAKLKSITRKIRDLLLIC